MRVTTLTAFVALASCASAPTNTTAPPSRGPGGDEFARLVHQTYSFKPHELSDEQQKQRGADLDRFWATVKRQPARYLPGLRRELQGELQLPFFYYDGGRLLMAVSRARQDHLIALRALDRVDLRDVNPLNYVETVHGLAREGLDTSAAAFKVLGESKFNPYVAEHALELGHAYSLMFMLLPSDHPAIPAAVVDRCGRERGETAKKALLAMIYHLATPEGDELLRQVAADLGESGAVREQAKTIFTAAVQASHQDLSHVPKETDLPIPRTVDEARAAQRKAAGRISDQALDEIEFFTGILRAIQNGGH